VRDQEEAAEDDKEAAEHLYETSSGQVAGSIAADLRPKAASLVVAGPVEGVEEGEEEGEGVEVLVVLVVSVQFEVAEVDEVAVEELPELKELGLGL